MGKMEKDHLKREAVYYVLGLVVALIVFCMAYSIVHTFPENVPTSSGDSLLQILITSDGVLMGFAGVIFVQSIASITDQQNAVYLRMCEKEQEREKLTSIIFALDLRRKILSVFTATTFLLLLYSIVISMQNIARDALLKPTDLISFNGFLLFPLICAITGITILMFGLIMPVRPPIGLTLKK
jgi:hypothetical protein